MNNDLYAVLIWTDKDIADIDLSDDKIGIIAPDTFMKGLIPFNILPEIDVDEHIKYARAIRTLSEKEAKFITRLIKKVYPDYYVNIYKVETTQHLKKEE